MLTEIIDHVIAFATMDRTVDGLRAVLILLITLVVTRLGSRWVRSVVLHRGDSQRAYFAGRFTGWVLLALGISAAFEEMGFKLHVLLGAAGVLSVAVGLAAQTTLSNLISGFFLFGERPFSVGDFVEIDGVSGEVLGIEMLATALRTADNRYVRVQNEVLLKNKLTNQTRFTLRRLELVVPLANDADFAEARSAVFEIVNGAALRLPEPAPSVFISGFGETSLQMTVWVWVETRNFLALRVSLSEAIHGALARTKRSSLAAVNIMK